MSLENVELHRRSVAAFNTREVEKFITFCDPEIELRSAVTATVYRGHDGVRKWYRDLADAFGEKVWLEPTAYFDAGEHTVTFHILHGRGRYSGADLAEPFAHVQRWRAGLIVHFQAYARQADAIRALGLSEDALVPISP
jgi:hypothetical protein